MTGAYFNPEHIEPEEPNGYNKSCGKVSLEWDGDDCVEISVLGKGRVQLSLTDYDDLSHMMHQLWAKISSENRQQIIIADEELEGD